MFVFESTVRNWSSHPAKGTPHGSVHSIHIDGTKGVEVIDTLNAAGKPIKKKHTKKTLKRADIQRLLPPGFSVRNNTRKSKSRKASRHSK
jgi:hypothetical protein